MSPRRRTVADQTNWIPPRAAIDGNKEKKRGCRAKKENANERSEPTPENLHQRMLPGKHNQTGWTPAANDGTKESVRKGAALTTDDPVQRILSGKRNAARYHANGLDFLFEKNDGDIPHASCASTRGSIEPSELFCHAFSVKQMQRFGSGGGSGGGGGGGGGDGGRGGYDTYAVRQAVRFDSGDDDGDGDGGDGGDGGGGRSAPVEVAQLGPDVAGPSVMSSLCIAPLLAGAASGEGDALNWYGDEEMEALLDYAKELACLAGGGDIAGVDAGRYRERQHDNQNNSAYKVEYHIVVVMMCLSPATMMLLMMMIVVFVYCWRHTIVSELVVSAGC